MAENYAIAGRVSIVPKGEWDMETTYQRLDLVTYRRKAYLAKKTSVGYIPTDGDYWMFLFETSGIATETDAGIVIPDNLTILIDGNGEISVQSMVGATETEDGKSGLVPKPTISDRNKALFGDGTWKDVETDIDIDNEMSDTSENPVQNKVVKKYVDDVDNKLITKADNITYNEDTSELQLKSGDEVLSTVIIEGGGGGGVKLAEPTNVTITNIDEGSNITWTDPDDIVVGGVTLAKWAGTIIIRKAGSAPTSKNDGTIVADVKTRNQHSSEPLVDTGLQNGVMYYYGIFPYNEDKVYTTTLTRSFTPEEIKPSKPTDISVKAGNTRVTVTFTKSSDVASTKIVYSTHEPTSPSDGTSIDSDSPCTITGLENGTKYYFKVYTYNAKGRYNNSDVVTATPVAYTYRTMTAVIDLSNSNPDTCISYEDDAAGMTKGSADWDDFLGYYPVLLDDSGNELGKLNPNNYTQYEDGTSAPINVLGSYDVMVAFPKRGLKISTANNKVTISMTDDPDNADFKYYAHSYGAHNNCDVVYVGAYKASVSNNKLYSCSGQSPLVSQTIGTFRTYANNRGTGYEQMTFYVRTFLCCAYILRFGNLNSQAAVGQGYVNASAITNTGATNAQGMNYGTTSQTTQIKCLGIEDLWGNVHEWVDGIYSSSTRNILTAIYNKNMNDTGSGYKDNGQGATTDIASYVSVPQGTTETGFVAKEVSGSATTYFCDSADLFASTVACAGGYYGNTDGAGVFRLRVYYSASMSGAAIGGRLIKFKIAQAA